MSSSHKVGDVLAFDNEYYVRATSGLADHRTRVLKYGDTFAVFNRYGDIEALGPLQFGLFHAESRHLSRMVLYVNDEQPQLLGSTVRQDTSLLAEQNFLPKHYSIGKLAQLVRECLDTPVKQN